MCGSYNVYAFQEGAGLISTLKFFLVNFFDVGHGPGTCCGTPRHVTPSSQGQCPHICPTNHHHLRIRAEEEKKTEFGIYVWYFRTKGGSGICRSVLLVGWLLRTRSRASSRSDDTGTQTIRGSCTALLPHELHQQLCGRVRACRQYH